MNNIMITFSLMDVPVHFITVEVVTGNFALATCNILNFVGFIFVERPLPGVLTASHFDGLDVGEG